MQVLSSTAAERSMAVTWSRERARWQKTRARSQTCHPQGTGACPALTHLHTGLQGVEAHDALAALGQEKAFWGERGAEARGGRGQRQQPPVPQMPSWLLALQLEVYTHLVQV